MSEIKKAPIIVYPNESYFNSTDSDAHVFVEDHTLSDILRYLVSQASGDYEEIETLLNLMKSQGNR